MPKIPWAQRLNRISLMFDRESSALLVDRHSGVDQKRGKYLVSLILDHILPECCSDEVIAALFRAIEQDRSTFDYAAYETDHAIPLKEET